MAAAKKPTASDIVMILVIALVAIEHDGKRYEAGEQFELPADAVTPLADVNAIKVVSEAPKAVAAPAAPAAPAKSS